jgi:DNA-binding beta-propeller fold protein YncE
LAPLGRSDLFAQGAKQPASQYHIVARHVIGGDGGWDYLRVDTAGHRLFVARSNRLSAVDLGTGKVGAELPGLNKGHGAAWDYATHHGFVTSGGDSTVIMFDLSSLKELGRTIAADDADAILYDAASNHVFTMNGDAHSSSVIDPVSGKRSQNIPLGGLPEFAVNDGKGKIWINIESTNEIVELDAKALKVARRWSIKPCNEPKGLAIDVTHSRLFSTCANKKMVVSDAVAGRVVATLPIGASNDGAAFDPSSGNAFASNGDATLTVVHEDTPDKYTVVQTLSTMDGARTITIDPKTHRIYTVGAKFGPVPAKATKDNPRKRPAMVPGSVTVLVIDR